MWNTLQALSAAHPDREFTLLIGADNWEVFSRWYHYEDIIAHYPIAIYPRTGSDIDVTTLPRPSASSTPDSMTSAARLSATP